MFPVEERIGDIRRALAANRDVVLTAPPGSGKTTCVPPALLGEPWLVGKKIVMLEPRRLAARNCASYIARMRGEGVGETVGYQVRLERRVSAKLLEAAHVQRSLIVRDDLSLENRYGFTWSDEFDGEWSDRKSVV